MTHVAVQDVIWLDDAANEIRDLEFPTYFVKHAASASGKTEKLYAIMPLTAEFRERYESAWRRLTKAESFKLLLKDADEKPGVWFVWLPT